MQPDKLPGNCIGKGSLTASSFDGVTRFRKRRHSPPTKQRYAKRRFSPLKLEDIMEVDISQPTHYLRLIFPNYRQWHCRSGHLIDEVQNWLSAFGDVKPVTEYHLTLTLLCCTEQDLHKDLTPLANILHNVKFDVGGFIIMGKTLVLNAKELVDGYGNTMYVNMAVPHIKEWLKVQGFTLYNSRLPLHMSVAKLHNLTDSQRAYIGSTAYIQQCVTRFFLAPIAVELVSLRAANNGHKQIVKSIPIHHDTFSWW
uniref:ORF4b protein n=1 Tax=Middle East respiratory syndrome-related coronavirus TaxID=1335626 RepID=A0A2I6PIW2_MERS|nr:ORF4b protein [Middle East respiratory syndrome-related coronavirus]